MFSYPLILFLHRSDVFSLCVSMQRVIYFFFSLTPLRLLSVESARIVNESHPLKSWPCEKSLQFTQLPGIQCGISPSPSPCCCLPCCCTRGPQPSYLQFTLLHWHWTLLIGRERERSYLPGGGECRIIIGWQGLNGCAGTPPTSLSAQKHRCLQLRSEKRRKYRSSGHLNHTGVGQWNSWFSLRYVVFF